MEIIKRKPIIISFTLFILIGLIAVVFFKSSITTSKELPVEYFKESNIIDADIGQYISMNHDYWNEELCWGGSKNYSFTVFEESYNDYVKDLSVIISAVGDNDLRADFKHVQSLLENASKTKNIDFLIEVHRIFHDLDVKYNGYSSSDYFKITAYGESH